MFTQKEVIEALSDAHDKIVDELEDNQEHIDEAIDKLEVESLRHHRNFLVGKKIGILLALNKVKKIK